MHNTHPHSIHVKAVQPQQVFMSWRWERRKQFTNGIELCFGVITRDCCFWDMEPLGQRQAKGTNVSPNGASHGQWLQETSKSTGPPHTHCQQVIHQPAKESTQRGCEDTTTCFFTRACSKILILQTRSRPDLSMQPTSGSFG